jgi:hypothetical protein
VEGEDVREIACFVIIRSHLTEKRGRGVEEFFGHCVGVSLFILEEEEEELRLRIVCFTQCLD